MAFMLNDPSLRYTTSGDLHGSRATDVRAEYVSFLLERFPLMNNHPDVAGLLRDPSALRVLGPALAESFRDAGVTAVCAPEARGPILAALVAVELNVGLILVRKAARNHPGADTHYTVGPTWRGSTESFQARSGDLSGDDVVLAVDDWVTTGSTLSGIRRFAISQSARYAGASVLVNKADDATLIDLGVSALVSFDEIMARRAHTEY